MATRRKKTPQEILEADVASSNIRSIRWNAESLIMRITFHSGYTYHFYDISRRLYNAIKDAGSPGKVFWARMARTKSYRRL